MAIEPADETRAAGVPLFVNVSVKNYGTRAASKVQLKLQSTFYPPDDLTKTQPDKLKGLTEELATLLIDADWPRRDGHPPRAGLFSAAGQARGRGQPAGRPGRGRQPPLVRDRLSRMVSECCVIDGTDEQQHAYYLDIAFRPLERSNTGIRPEVKPASFLRDATLDALNVYSAIYLLDVPRLDGRGGRNARSVRARRRRPGDLRRAGHPTSAIYNHALYQEGQGVLPAPLGADAELPPSLDPAEPDLELTGHPIFSASS